MSCFASVSEHTAQLGSKAFMTQNERIKEICLGPIKVGKKSERKSIYPMKMHAKSGSNFKILVGSRECL